MDKGVEISRDLSEVLEGLSLTHCAGYNPNA